MAPTKRGWFWPRKLTSFEIRGLGIRESIKVRGSMTGRSSWIPTNELLGRITHQKYLAIEELAKKNPELLDELVESGKIRWARAKTLSKLVK